MRGFSKKIEPVGHAPRLLLELRRRAGLTVRDVAAQAGVSYQAVHVAEGGKGKASMDTIMAVARVCGASREELDRLPALVAMDKGSLAVPMGASEERVGAAMKALGGVLL